MGINSTPVPVSKKDAKGIMPLTPFSRNGIPMSQGMYTSPRLGDKEGIALAVLSYRKQIHADLYHPIVQNPILWTYLTWQSTRSGLRFEPDLQKYYPLFPTMSM